MLRCMLTSLLYFLFLLLSQFFTGFVFKLEQQIYMQEQIDFSEVRPPRKRLYFYTRGAILLPYDQY